MNFFDMAGQLVFTIGSVYAALYRTYEIVTSMFPGMTLKVRCSTEGCAARGAGFARRLRKRRSLVNLQVFQ